MLLLEKTYKFKCQDEMEAKLKVEALRKEYDIKDYKIKNVSKKDDFYSTLQIKLFIASESDN